MKIDAKFDILKSEQAKRHEQNIKLLVGILLAIFGFAGEQLFTKVFHG